MTNLRKYPKRSWEQIEIDWLKKCRAESKKYGLHIEVNMFYFKFRNKGFSPYHAMFCACGEWDIF